jgi:hypothetical protein
LRPANSADLADSLAQIDRLQAQPQLARGNAAQIQQVVDQLGLQFDVPADHRHVFADDLGHRIVVL